MGIYQQQLLELGRWSANRFEEAAAPSMGIWMAIEN
jgi:hypothetical protein